jgi:nucleoside-diphosphate-sugar epimerase
MPRALIIGGTGLVGRAAARRLLDTGWSVDVTGREASHLPSAIADATFTTADRDDAAALRRALGGGVDLLVDCVCYTAAQARLLLPLLDDVGSTVMISSKAVYVDDHGNHTNSPVAPHFDGPVTETQPTMTAGDGDFQTREGYGANKVAAENVLLDSGAPVTVLRPSKIHGAGALRPREWVFVKRALDRRPAVFLAARGAGIDHTTAALNLAALIEAVAAHPSRRVLNSADPDAPNALEISRAIARAVGHTWTEVLLDETGGDALGAHPWEARYPIVLDMTAAATIGYVPVGDYATTVIDEVDWLVQQVKAAGTSDGAGGVGLPAGLDAEFFDGYFDYPREDRYLADHHSDADAG